MATHEVAVKDGWKTSEFWLTLAAGIVSLVPGVMPSFWHVVLTAVVTAAYSISRGLVKSQPDVAAK